MIPSINMWYLFRMSLVQRASFTLAIGFCFVALWLGLSLPIISLEKFWLFSNEVSVLSAIAGLFAESEWLLATIVLLFSVCLPNLKLLTTLLGLYAPQIPAMPIAKGLMALSRWSMLDVFLVAVLVSAVKLGAVAEATTLPGLYWLVAATLLSMLIGCLSDKFYRWS